MDCSVEKYIRYVKNFMFNFYRIVLDEDYQKKYVSPFVEKYIEVRYYNNSIYEKEKNFINKINKELNLIATGLFEAHPKHEELIKNVFALFGYVLYLDDCIDYDNVGVLLKSLFNDKNIKIEYKDETKEELKAAIMLFNSEKKRFFNQFESKEFFIKNRRVAYNLYVSRIEHNLKITNLYSDYAINKAFDSGVVAENKTLLLYILLSKEVLVDVIKLDFKKHYVVDFPTSLLNKEKKINRYINILDNDILKQKISIRFLYKDYMKYKEVINSFINQGFSVSLTMDDTFDGDFSSFILFSYIFVYEKDECYDMIIDSKDNIKAKVVTL